MQYDTYKDYYTTRMHRVLVNVLSDYYVLLLYMYALYVFSSMVELSRVAVNSHFATARYGSQAINSRYWSMTVCVSSPLLYCSRV